MVLVTDKLYFMEERVKKNLDDVVERVLKNFDFRALVTGDPGDGKSKITRQIAYYLVWAVCQKLKRPVEFGMDDIFFDVDEFLSKMDYYVDNEIHYRAMVLDEAREATSAARALSKINEKLKNKLSRIRKLNLFIFIVAPDFFEFDQGIAVKATYVMIRVKSSAKGERGFFKWWSKKLKRLLYHKGKERYGDYSCVPAKFRGRFYGKDVIDEEEYDRKALQYSKTESKDDSFNQHHLNSAKKKMFYDQYANSVMLQKMSQVELARFYDVTPETLRGWVREMYKLSKTPDEGKGVRETMREIKLKAQKA